MFHTVFFVKVSLGSCVGSLLCALRRWQPLPGVSVTGGTLRRSWESSLVGELARGRVENKRHQTLIENVLGICLSWFLGFVGLVASVGFVVRVGSPAVSRLAAGPSFAPLFFFSFFSACFTVSSKNRSVDLPVAELQKAPTREPEFQVLPLQR